MATVRSRAITAMTAAAALALGVIPAAFTASSILASGEDSTLTAATDYFPGPTMTLSATGTQGVIAVDGTNLRQTFTGGQYCEIAYGSDSADLLRLEGDLGDPTAPPTVADGKAGFRDGALGVYESGVTNASQCFRVDANSFTNAETLVVTLGQGLQGMKARSATFDLMKQSGDLTVIATAYNGSTPVATATPWNSPKREKVGTRKLMTLAAPAGQYFDSVRISATLGSFSVVGTSTFQLVEPAEYPKFCPGESQPEGGTTVTYVGEATGTDPNPEDSVDTFGGSCFGITLTDGATSVRFLKPLDVSPDAQLIFTKTWMKTGSFGPEVTLDDVAIDFEFFANERFTNMPYCPPYLYKDRVLTGFTPSNPSNTETLADLRSRDMVQDDPATTDKVEGEGTQFACIAEPRDVETSATLVKITDKIYLIGDAKMRL